MQNIDIISNLTARKGRLIRQKVQLEEKFHKEVSEINSEIIKIDQALSICNEVLKSCACQYCGGTGEERYTDAAGDTDTRPCSCCLGTGIAP